MVRASKPGVAAKIVGSTFTHTDCNALDTAIDAAIDDYLSQTDAAAQTVASAVNFTNATLTKSGVALATTTSVSDHAALTTGVHGVGAGTIAKTSDIKVANLTGLPFVTVGPSGCTYTTDGTADDVQINQALTATANGGIVQLMPYTTYNLTDALPLVGIGMAATVPQRCVYGGGLSTILNQGTANKDVFTLSNGAVVDLRGFRLIEPAANSGLCINGVDTGADTEVSTFLSYMDNISLEGCDATHEGMLLKNPFYCNFGYFRTQTNSDAVTFEQTLAGTNTGNSHFRHLHVESLPSTKYALTLKSLTNNIINFCTFDHIDAAVNGGGIHLASDVGSVDHNAFNGLDLECEEKSIFIDATADGGEVCGNTFKGYMMVKSGVTAIDASANNAGHGGNRYDLDIQLIDANAGTVILNDGVSGWKPMNEYKLNIYASVAALTTNQFTIASHPKITWQQQAGTTGSKNPNSGATANVSDGGTITHLVGLTPTSVSAVGSVAGEVVAVTAVAATTFTVAIKKISDGSAGTAQTIYWRAGYNSD